MREREGRCGTSEPCARIAWYKNWEFELFFSAFFDFFPPYPSSSSCHFLCTLNYFRPYINSCLLLLFESVFVFFLFYCLRHNLCSETEFLPVLSMTFVLPFVLPVAFSPRSYALSFFLCLLSLSFYPLLSRCPFPIVISPILLFWSIFTTLIFEECKCTFKKVKRKNFLPFFFVCVLLKVTDEKSRIWCRSRIR